MTRDDEIRRVVAQILQHGIVNIRILAHQGNTEACFREADHLHNLPHLAADFNESLLTFYCDTERPSFLNSGGRPESFERLWKQLDALRASPKQGTPSDPR